MPDPHRRYEIRCPVHGFIVLDDWEREIISHPVFQRLRRIRQLAWTDQIYPGAMHTRFEHSLGVMHIATMLYDAVVERSRDVLHNLGYQEAGLKRTRTLVRLTALLHDIGHGPFSHGSEELFPMQANGKSRYKHEDYSVALIRGDLRDVIENHPFNKANYGFKADDIAALLAGSGDAGSALLWKDLISGQMDADRMDYLLRDALHAGVRYGQFDLQRLIRTIEIVPVVDLVGSEFEDETENNEPDYRLGISEGGIHAAEALILARYFMFTQVYFHKTRVAFDYHLEQALKELLPNGNFPLPDTLGLHEYLRWDDWKVLGLLAEGQGGEHGNRLAFRNHYRKAYDTPEVAREADWQNLEKARTLLGDLLMCERSADKSWYKLGKTEINVRSSNPDRSVLPLSKYSSVAEKIEASSQRLLYVKPEDSEAARQKLKSLGETS